MGDIVKHNFLNQQNNIMKFYIKKRAKKEKIVKGLTVYGSGEDYHAVYDDILFCKKIGEGKFKYRTGLTEQDIKSSPVLTDYLKKVYIEKLPKVIELIKNANLEEALDNTNSAYWERKGRLRLSPENMNTIFDDETDIEALILKYNIAGGGYSDIAASFDCAAGYGKTYYIVEVEEFSNESFTDKVADKLKAMGMLNDLYSKGSTEALLYLSWVLLDSTKGFTRNNSKEVIVEAISEYIEGKLVGKDKKQCPIEFVKYATKWKSDKEGLITEALFNAGVYFGHIFLLEGKYTTKERATILGPNKELAIKNLSDVKNIDELKELKAIIDKQLDR